MEALIALALRFGLLSLVAIGGANALIPQIHAETVTRLHWLDDRTFAELVAVAQSAPGPNVLLIPLIGWHVAGWPGALVALSAFLMPSSTLAIVVARVFARHPDSARLGALRGALRPVTAGLLIASGIVLVRTVAAASGPHAALVPEIAIAAGVAILSTRTTVNPLWWLLAAGAVGALIAR